MATPALDTIAPRATAVTPVKRIPMPGLPAREHLRHVAAAAACVWLLSALGGLIGYLAPGVAPGTRPHPTLHGTLGELVSVLVNNLRVLCAPFLLAALRWPAGRVTRLLGDVLIAGLIGLNTITVGFALGAYGNRLVPYVPQLPLEWAALAVAAAAWLSARHAQSTRSRVLGLYALGTLALAAGAAAVEVGLTPHVHSPGLRSERRALTLINGSLAVCEYRAAVCLRRVSRRDGPPLQGRFAPFPSLRSVPLHRLTGAFRTTSTTPRSPQGGTIT